MLKGLHYFRLKSYFLIYTQRSTVFTWMQDKVFSLKFDALIFEVVLNSHMKKRWRGLHHAGPLGTTPHRVKPRPASPDHHMRSALLWDITQCRLVIPYWLFGTTWRYHLKGQEIQVRSTFQKLALFTFPRKDAPNLMDSLDWVTLSHMALHKQ
jgi:hypothetical protein